jgi:hypothetical protein
MEMIKIFKREKLVRRIFNLFLILILTLTGCKNVRAPEPSFSDIESGFKNIPDTIQTSVYWYWLSDNISKEGVVKDLESMKEAGINRAFIGNIGLSDLPSGRVKIFTDEWWDILHTALKKATELEIGIGIFNSPGWSQSGGPWIKPEQSMRYLNSSENHITGPQTCITELAAPNRSPSLQNYPGCDQQVQQLASALWGNVDGIKVKTARVGKGMIISGMAMKDALDLIDVIPDCKFNMGDPA